MSYLSKSDYDYINLAGCIRGQADRLGIDTEGVPLEGVVVRIANAAPPAAREQDTREPSDAEVLFEIRATVERYWADFEQADKWVDPDGRRAQVFARLGNTLDRILDGTPEPHHGPDDLRAVAARAERDSYESYADRSRTIRVLTSAARRLADVIEYAELRAWCHENGVLEIGGTRIYQTPEETVAHVLRLAHGDTTNENRSE